MRYTVVPATLLLSACASTIPAPAPRPVAAPERTAAAFPVRPAIEKRGLEAVMGKDAGALKRLFGEPRLDVVEVVGRKLQWTGKACVLDAFLYPDGKGGAEIVTHVDARRSDGAAVDRAACVDALQRR
ncbi:MAG TPA: hypothetical protein VGN36_07190 [Sphingorhabdus sp.]|jgi:hypothetical protein|nr:hypothetical protein [Sphingorhabdus sp.]